MDRARRPVLKFALPLLVAVIVIVAGVLAGGAHVPVLIESGSIAGMRVRSAEKLLGLPRAESIEPRMSYVRRRGLFGLGVYEIDFTTQGERVVSVSYTRD